MSTIDKSGRIGVAVLWAALAAPSGSCAAEAARTLTIDFGPEQGLPSDAKLQVRILPATNLDVPLTAEHIPLANDYTTEPMQGGVRITLNRVEAKQAYHLQFTR